MCEFFDLSGAPLIQMACAANRENIDGPRGFRQNDRMSYAVIVHRYGRGLHPVHGIAATKREARTQDEDALRKKRFQHVSLRLCCLTTSHMNIVLSIGLNLE
jgi:hypothetical protein